MAVEATAAKVLVLEASKAAVAMCMANGLQTDVRGRELTQMADGQGLTNKHVH